MRIQLNFISIYTINISFSVYQCNYTVGWGVINYNFPPESHKTLQRLIAIVTHKNPITIPQIHLTKRDVSMLTIYIPHLVSQISVGQSYMNFDQILSGCLCLLGFFKRAFHLSVEQSCFTHPSIPYQYDLAKFVDNGIAMLLYHLIS